MNGPIRDVFLKHNSEDNFALYLQHRHHQLGCGEHIVKVGGTAHVMTVDDAENIVSAGSKIAPSTWTIDGGEAHPTEFSAVSAM